MRIAIDAMGGDHAPSEVVKGVLDAAQNSPQTTFILAGDKDKIGAELAKNGKPFPNIVIEHASQIIGMEEHPVEALRRKRDSSIIKCVKLVRDGKADALVSAGNTGAVVAAARLALGLLEGVKRAGIAATIPTEKGYTALIDVGANINCKPLHLLQYGLMASLYSRAVFNHTENPTVGLLNIGEESVKGNVLSQETYQSFKRSSLNFIGNVEGHEIFSGKCNVIVCDGFVGNTIIKMGEGLVSYLLKQMIGELGTGEHIKKSLGRLAEKMDYSEYGGAPLLGIKGIAIICHGRSHAKAITNAIRVATTLSENKMNEHIVAELKKLSWWGRLQDWFGKS